MSELTDLSASALASLVRGRKVSPVEVVEAHLRRIEQVNPRLNAVVTLSPDALEQARKVEEKIVQRRPAGPLAGVPVTVKDTIETAGLRTTFGSRLFAAHVPAEDAPAVARLRMMGAVVIGKTNASELALDYTADNPVHGRTNHPLDPALTPGGSSGGCAAAVAAGLSAAGLGSDLVGSLRIPAHFCGIASLRPTAGSIDGRGHLPPVTGRFALAAALGPLARRVEDLELLFDVLTARPGVPVEIGVERTPEFLESMRGRRVAWYSDDGMTPVTAETRAAVESAVASLKSAGLVCEEATPPHVGRATDLWLGLFSGATREFLRETYAGREGEAGPVARLLLGREAAGEDEYARAFAEREQARGQLLEWMREWPLVVCPVGAVPAYAHDTRKVTPDGGRTWLGTFQAFSYAHAFSVFDLPAACVPAGRTREGLPVGVQIAGPPGAERQVLAAARIVELAA